MPFYSNQKLVDSFEYRGVFVEIYQAQMGAHHCDLDHDPAERKCRVCHKPIRSIKVHLIFCFGHEVETLVNVNALAARRIAEQLIDDQIDRLDNPFDEDKDKPDDPPRGDDSGKDKPDVPDLPDLPDLPGNDGKRGRGERPLAPSNRLQRLAERMKKLGWPLKALNILREELKKRGN
jgi:hypothetical protein